MHWHHKTLLQQVISRSGKGTKHTSSDSYLGNSHPRYAINAPTLRAIAKEWMKANQSQLTSDDFSQLLTSLIEGVSSTEKVMAGIVLGYSPAALRDFDIVLFDRWLGHLEGWAEVDSLCTGDFPARSVPARFPEWRKLLLQFAKSEQIEKRRASIVLLCSPLSKVQDDRLVALALQNIQRLANEKDVLITKAISWVLRSAVKNYKKDVENFLKLNSNSLPKIAVRETLVKLKTGKKTKSQSL